MFSSVWAPLGLLWLMCFGVVCFLFRTRNVVRLVGWALECCWIVAFVAIVMIGAVALEEWGSDVLGVSKDFIGVGICAVFVRGLFLMKKSHESCQAPIQRTLGVDRE